MTKGKNKGVKINRIFVYALRDNNSWHLSVFDLQNASHMCMLFWPFVKDFSGEHKLLTLREAAGKEIVVIAYSIWKQYRANVSHA